MQAVQQDQKNSLPTIDDFVAALQAIRLELTQNGQPPTVGMLRPALQRFAEERRERYLAAATNSFDLERRMRDWDRAKISGLFGQN